MSGPGRLVAFEVRPEHLLIGGPAYKNIAHLFLRNPMSGVWGVTAACGCAAWTQAELDAQLSPAPDLEHRPRCGMEYCARLWKVYDLREK